MKRAAALFAILLCLYPLTARAACTSPTGNERDLIYNGNYHTYQFCNGTNWIASGGSTAPFFKNVGYFVLSKSTWTGNLGAFNVADAKCLTELTTNTGWQGYATANANGQLIADKVHAFITVHGGLANTLLPNATYYFANANDATAGGATFTTDGNGDGPNDANAWNGLTYFNGDFTYWGDRSPNSTTLWADSMQSSNRACSTTDYWDTGTNAQSGYVGESTATDQTRWLNAATVTCDTLEHLICYVNP